MSCSPLTDQLRHQNVDIYHLLSFWFTFRVRQDLHNFADTVLYGLESEGLVCSDLAD